MAAEPTLDPSERSTVELVGLAAEGNPAALEDLYARYLPPLQRWAHGRLPRWARDLMETDDLVQETILRSLGRIHRFEVRQAGAFHAYLRTAVKNRVRDEIRRLRGRLPASTLDEVEDWRPSPLERTLGHETMECYESALSVLSTAEAEMVLARIELGLSFQEIARITGKASPDAARMAVNRALAKLAQYMADARRRTAT